MIAHCELVCPELGKKLVEVIKQVKFDFFIQGS